MNLHLLRGVFSGLIADLAGYVRGSIIRAGAAAWEVHDAKTAGQILVGDGTDIRSVAVDGDATLIGVLDTRYLRLSASNDPVTAGLEINALTAAEPVLVLQTTDDNATNPILEIQNAAGAMLSEIEKDGNLNFITALAANPGIIQVNDTRFFHLYGSYNLFVGLNAGNFGLTGAGNTGIGENCLAALTSGDNNTAIGIDALRVNTTGRTNVALGKNVLYTNTTGSTNMAIGMDALHFNVVGNANVAVGINALYRNTAGHNTAIGGDALFSNTTGQPNVALGTNALYSNTTGRNNMAVGMDALAFNVTGNANVGVGVNALWKNTASENTAIGGDAFLNNTTGRQGVSIGTNALYANTTGSFNTGVGYFAGGTQQTGSNNVFVGRRAGHGGGNHNKSGCVIVGCNAGENMTGSGNICIGYQAGNVIAAGASNIIIGYDIDPTGAAVSSELNIGALIYGKLDTNRGGVNVTPPNLTAAWHVDQPTDDAAIPVLLLDQADVDQDMIEFVCTIGVGNAIEAVGAKTLTVTHFIKVTLPGPLTRYIPVGTIA